MLQLQHLLDFNKTIELQVSFSDKNENFTKPRKAHDFCLSILPFLTPLFSGTHSSEVVVAYCRAIARNLFKVFTQLLSRTRVEPVLSALLADLYDQLATAHTVNYK